MSDISEREFLMNMTADTRLTETAGNTLVWKDNLYVEDGFFEKYEEQISIAVLILSTILSFPVAYFTHSFFAGVATYFFPYLSIMAYKWKNGGDYELWWMPFIVFAAPHGWIGLALLYAASIFDKFR